jgi:hypothetical protein
MGEPMTGSGQDAVRMRGLFGGETAERASMWVARIESEAISTDRERLIARIEALPDDCHDHEGLGCERGPTGERLCYSLQRADVLAIIRGEK